MIKYYMEVDLWAHQPMLREVKSNDPSNIKEIVKDIDSVVRFRIYEQNVIFHNGETFKSEIKNSSKWYYVGKLLSPTDIRDNYPQFKGLISKMKKENCNAVLIKKQTPYLLTEDAEIYNP